MYATYQVRVCGGLDSYGYVSTGSLIASGHLTERQPLVPLLPFEQASAAAAPVGYVAGVDGRTQVPRFPIGLPLVMALFKIMFGDAGPFFVSLVMAYVTIAIALNTSIQIRVPERFRGRVVSIYLMSLLGGVPVGALVAGRISDVIGLDVTTTASGVALSAFVVLAVVRFSRMAALDETLETVHEGDDAIASITPP